MTRTVVLHYHLFKNAGTSLDAAFKENLEPDEWVTDEFSGNPEANRAQVTRWIQDNTHARVFSSHTAALPPPKIKKTRVIPVIFLRHPLDRIASAYDFESRQDADGFGATLARNTDLSGYVETRLSLPNDRQCRNFQTHRLSMHYPPSKGSELNRATRAVRKLPFVGIVDSFADSLNQLTKILEQKDFSIEELRPLERNVGQRVRAPLDERVSKIESRMNPTSFKALVDANEDDLALYDYAVTYASKNWHQET